MNAGDLRHRIIIKTPGTTTLSTKGEPTVAYTTVCTVWAKILPLSTREVNLARSVGGLDTHRMTIRYRDDVDRKCIVEYGGRTYSVSGEPRNLDTRGEWLEFTAQAKS